jgi:hypothetical protein
VATGDPIGQLESFLALLEGSVAEATDLRQRLEACHQDLAGEAQALQASLDAMERAVTDGHSRVDLALEEALLSTRALQEAAALGIQATLAPFAVRLTELTEELSSDGAALGDLLREGQNRVKAEATAVGRALLSIEEGLASALTDTTGALAQVRTGAVAGTEAVRELQPAVETMVDAVGEALESALPAVLDAAIQGFGEAVREALTGTETNPFARAGETSQAVADETEDAALATGDHLLGVADERLGITLESWAPALTQAHDASTVALNDRGPSLRRELEDLGAVLQRGGETATAFAPLLPQLAPARDAVERIQELLESMNPF